MRSCLPRHSYGTRALLANSGCVGRVEISETLRRRRGQRSSRVTRLPIPACVARDVLSQAVAVVVRAPEDDDGAESMVAGRWARAKSRAASSIGADTQTHATSLGRPFRSDLDPIRPRYGSLRLPPKASVPSLGTNHAKAGNSPATFAMCLVAGRHGRLRMAGVLVRQPHMVIGLASEPPPCFFSSPSIIPSPLSVVQVVPSSHCTAAPAPRDDRLPHTHLSPALQAANTPLAHPTRTPNFVAIMEGTPGPGYDLDDSASAYNPSGDAGAMPAVNGEAHDSHAQNNEAGGSGQKASNATCVTRKTHCFYGNRVTNVVRLF